jgi:hypothetical protein
VPGDSQAQSGAALFAGARRVDAVEALKEALLLGLGDALGGIVRRTGLIRPVRKGAWV